MPQHASPGVLEWGTFKCIVMNDILVPIGHSPSILTSVDNLELHLWVNVEEGIEPLSSEGCITGKMFPKEIKLDALITPRHEVVSSQKIFVE